MKTAVGPLLVASLLAGAAYAQAPAIPPPFVTEAREPVPQAEAPAPSEPAPQPVAVAEPADLSAVPGGDAARRDPFWPVGYMPEKKEPASPTPQQAAAPAAVPKASDWDGAQKMLTISGVSRVSNGRTSNRTEFMAIVNGKLVEEGDVVALPLNGVTYRWQVQSIGPSGVSLQKLDASEP